MTKTPVYLAGTPLQHHGKTVSGEFTEINDESYYCISNVDQMRPFFMTLVSHSDHWLFFSSNGGITAGRRNENSSLFPYETDDKLTDNAENRGGKTILFVYLNGKRFLWEPFSFRTGQLYRVQHNIYKNTYGNKVIFEAINEDLQIKFRYGWLFSEQFGIVKKCTLSSLNAEPFEVEILDGLQGIVPFGVDTALQTNRSNLVNAYKRNQLEDDSKLGLFTLSAAIIDRAEPAESLKATTVWSTGIPVDHVLLSNRQLDLFRNGAALTTENDIKGEPGSYFIHTTQKINEEGLKWYLVGEVNQDHAAVFSLKKWLRETDQAGIISTLEDDIERGTHQLMALISKSDGVQMSGDRMSNARHYYNVLFNIMRGGIFDEDYHVHRSDLEDFFRRMNTKLTATGEFLSQLNNILDYHELIAKAGQFGHPDITRLCYEYLPLSFSRRHGDPSRPWNKFSIDIKDEEGRKVRYYAGNWRDIFQNWEALAVSFPGFILSMITKFVNASTIDGYNPYRITRNGIDWEVIEPDDPWSYIGYWGDHQIIYLLKLLELANNHNPERLQLLLDQTIFVYANVPYRIKPYEAIVRDPQDTIVFDHNLEKEVEDRVRKYGGDGKLVFDDSGNTLRATLMEKLLVTTLTKLTNFIPEAGIWLNTQRPEWNDANNALVGNGASMVTLYYLRRFLQFLSEKVISKTQTYDVHYAVYHCFVEMQAVFDSFTTMMESGFSDTGRRSMVNALGKTGEEYRLAVYGELKNNTTELSGEKLHAFVDTVLAFLDHSIAVNQRADRLYHSYNLVEFDGGALTIRHLYEMLEGQVAVLSSGFLDLGQTVEVLDALKESTLYREDQYSYLLYPNKELPGFLEKNIIPKSFIQNSTLAQELRNRDDQSIIQCGPDDLYFFSGNIKNGDDLRKSLEKLRETDLQPLIHEETDAYLNQFELLFNHKAFTGRSGTFFGYEGLGSIYWHMVSKLLLAVQENIYRFTSQSNDSLTGKLIDHYYEIRAGIGINKSPELYGAFPMEAYSHTPNHKGAQQPGMTGQVKEDILNRWAELGVIVKDGHIHFHPTFLNVNEYLNQEEVFTFFDIYGEKIDLRLSKGQLAFTYCQVPVVYQRGEHDSISIIEANGKEQTLPGLTTDAVTAEQIFRRTGQVKKVEVTFA